MNSRAFYLGEAWTLHSYWDFEYCLHCSLILGLFRTPHLRYCYSSRQLIWVSPLSAEVIAGCFDSLWLLFCLTPPVKNVASEELFVHTTWGLGIQLWFYGSTESRINLCFSCLFCFALFFFFFFSSFYQRDRRNY